MRNSDTRFNSPLVQSSFLYMSLSKLLEYRRLIPGHELTELSSYSPHNDTFIELLNSQQRLPFRAEGVDQWWN